MNDAAGSGKRSRSALDDFRDNAAAPEPHQRAEPPPELVIRELDRDGLNALLAFYDGFEPLGAALGLPPASAESRREWLERLLAEACNVGGFWRGERLVGHAVLAPSGPGEAEIAFFVHQDYRRNRIGTRLVREALARAGRLGADRVWASVSGDNVPSLRLLHTAGFQIRRFSWPTLELELFVPRREPAIHPV